VRYQVEKIKQMGVEVLSVYLGEMTDEQRESFGAMYPDYVEVKEMDRLIPTILEGIFQMM
jgi:ABC-type transporter MlaC component